MTVHPWETGRDNSPEWDRPAAAIDTTNVEPYVRKDLSHIDGDMRPKKADYDRYVALLQFGRDKGWDHAAIAKASPFRVIDVGLTMILLRADRDLHALALALGRTQDAAELSVRIALSEKGVEWLWDVQAGAFCSRDVITGESSRLVSNASFLAAWAGVGSAAQRDSLSKNFDRIASAVKYMVPSCDPEHAAFDRLRYWRGPIWSVMNFMIGEGLSEQGDMVRAKRVQSDTRALVAEHGFFEAFCPLTGQGAGGPDFSWTAAVWLDQENTTAGVRSA